MTDHELRDCPRCGHCCPQPEQEPDAYGYAKRLALAIWEQHYKDVAPQWKPFDDLMGVLTQIDNMTARLTTPPAAQPFWDLFDENQRLRAELKFNTTPPTVQLEQEPVAWRYDQAKYRTNDLRGRQWAFNVFSQTRPYIDEMVQNVTPLYTAPPAAQPEQNCVGWFGYDTGVRAWFETNKGDDDSIPLYKAPRKWVGLTDGEIKRLWSQSLADSEGETYLPLQEYAQAIETKLREKNGG